MTETRKYDGKDVHTPDTFTYENAKIGDYVNAEVVMDAMDALPPACMRRDCAQLGEPYSHRQDPDTGKLRPTYATFKCVSGDFREGVWEYCGNCFRGETTERGKDPVYVTSS